MCFAPIAIRLIVDMGHHTRTDAHTDREITKSTVSHQQHSANKSLTFSAPTHPFPTSSCPTNGSQKQICPKDTSHCVSLTISNKFWFHMSMTMNSNEMRIDGYRIYLKKVAGSQMLIYMMTDHFRVYSPLLHRAFEMGVTLCTLHFLL